jgi:phage tail sheath gpL-like
MYKNFNLTEEERKQILEQHSSYGYRKPLITESSASAMAADAIAKSKSGQGSKSIAAEITNCITSNGYTHLAILTTGAGATALGALAALFASGVGTVPALIVAAAGAIMVTIEGFLTSSGIGSASVTSELTDLHNCLKNKKVI